MEEETNQLWERLELWQKNTDVGMTKERYLEMEHQLGREPDPKRCPPGLEDLPESVHDALNIFNSLGDRVYPEIGYMGKDYTNLKMLLKLYEVENIELVYSILLRLDSQAIKKSQDSLKREYDKIKSRSRGQK